MAMTSFYYPRDRNGVLFLRVSAHQGYILYRKNETTCLLAKGVLLGTFDIGTDEG